MLRTFLYSVLAAGFAFAFQDAFASLKLTRESFNSNVKDYVTRELGDAEPYLAMPSFPSASRPVLLGMNDSARAAVVKELALAAKSIVMNPAFEAAYAATLKTQHNAIDHGLKVADTTASFERATKSGDTAGIQNKMEDTFRDQLRKTVIEQNQEISSYDGSMLEILADGLKAQMESIPPRTAVEKAQHAKAKTFLDEAKKLSKTNVASARQKYTAGSLLAVYIDSGTTKSAQADEENRDQQLNFNKRVLRPNLKLRLLAFVAEAKTVDFKAVTQSRGGKAIFVKAAYEEKTSLWKLLYRLGPGGTLSAVAVAQTWAAEL